MKQLRKTAPATAENHIVVRSFSRKEAASLMEAGERHIHSTALGFNDRAVKATLKRLGGEPFLHPWIPIRSHIKLRILGSGDRGGTIQTVLSSLFASERSSTKDTLKLVIEELTCNAVYHAIRDPKGQDYYQRTGSVRLKDSETVELSCHRSDDGVFLAVTDQGGTLRLKDIARGLSRCYNRDIEQVEKKESGAGLGFYMIFENTTHVDISVIPGIKTTISVWLPISGRVEANYFSLNFWGADDDSK